MNLDTLPINYGICIKYCFANTSSVLQGSQKNNDIYISQIQLGPAPLVITLRNITFTKNINIRNIPFTTHCLFPFCKISKRLKLNYFFLKAVIDSTLNVLKFQFSTIFLITAEFFKILALIFCLFKYNFC